MFRGSFSAAVAYHDVAVLRITPVEGPLDDSWRPWHAQPLYAPQPINIAVPQASAWIEGFSEPGSSSGAAQKARLPAAAGATSLPSAKGPPGFAIVLSVVAAAAALCVVGYFVVQTWRMRGWQQLEETEGARKAAELAHTTNGRLRDGVNY